MTMPYADNNGMRIHYHVEDEGQPLLLLHGLNHDQAFLQIDQVLPRVKNFLKEVSLNLDMAKG